METLAVTEYTHSRVSDRQTEKTVPRPVFAAGDAGKTVKIQSIYKKKKNCSVANKSNFPSCNLSSLNFCTIFIYCLTCSHPE